MRLAVAETVDEIDAVIGKSRQLLTKATDANDEALFDAAAYLVAVATRKGGKLLLSGHAAADFGPNKIAAWRRYAAMSHEKFCSEIEVAKMDARRRRQVRGGTSEAAAKIVSSEWYCDNLGVLTRFRFGVGLDEDAAAVERELTAGLRRTPTGRAAA